MPILFILAIKLVEGHEWSKIYFLVAYKYICNTSSCYINKEIVRNSNKLKFEEVGGAILQQKNAANMREIVHMQAGQCGNQIGAKVIKIKSSVKHKNF